MAVKRWGVSSFLFIFVLAFMVTWLTVSLLGVRTADLRITRVIDGDTVVLNNGEKVRLLGIDAPDMGEEGSEKAGIILEGLVRGGRVWIEGDRYGEDMYGRILAWVWAGCESEPEFKGDNYMEDKGRIDTPWVEENPIGCKKGILVNEQLLKMGLVEPYFVEGEGELKYQERLKKLAEPS